MAEKKAKICIIGGNLQDRETFRRYLLQDAESSYYFFDAETGKRGLELCKTVQPDCILLDYNLPDMDGLEFLSALVDEQNSLPFPVVVLTEAGDESVAVQAMKRGAQDYLVKDEMTPGNLFRAVHSAIERTSMRRILEQKNQSMQAFAYALAHDLQAPLRAISNFAQILAEDYHTVLDAKGQRYIHNIVRASFQMDRLIDDLLNYTRIEHREINSKPIALGHLMRQIVDSFAERVAEVQAKVTIADDLPVVYGDATLIKQIFINLLENALLYRKPGVPPQITITWRGDGPDAMVCVADNGIGIAEKHQDKIFNIFQRLHGYDEYPGTGIGLAIVKKSAELMGGLIWVESVVGEGSYFYVRLPLYT